MEKNKDEQVYMKKQRVFEASQARHVTYHHKLLEAQRSRVQQYTQDLSYNSVPYKNHKQFRIKVDVKNTFTMMKHAQ